MKKTCAYCNKIFDAKKTINRYCSYRCSGTSKKKTVIKNCLTCNRIIHTVPHQINRKKYCSIQCYNKAKTGRPAWNKQAPIVKKCLICGNIIHTITSQRTRKKYCSKKCSNIGKSRVRCSPQTEFKKGERLGIKNSNWKGGRFKHKQGYIFVLQPDHPFPSNSTGYVFEHRLIMEKHLGRYLQPSEVVHHINKMVHDNRIKNLMLFKNNSKHIKHHQRMIRSKS